MDCAMKAFALFENCKTLFVFGSGKGHVREDCFFGEKTENNTHIWGVFSKRRVKPKTCPFSQRCFGRGL